MTEQQPEPLVIPGVTRWRKRATVEAIQWCGHNLDDVQLFCGTLVYPATMTEGPAFKVEREDPRAVVWVARRGMWEWAPQGCWIVSEPHGSGQSLAPVAADVFAVTYEPASEPLVMPANEPWTPEQIACFKERLKAAMANPGPLRVLPSDHCKDRAEAAEAKLSAIAAYCREHKGAVDFSWMRAGDILAIAGSEEEAPESSGAALIAAERARQVAVEGWTAEHDAEHADDDLARAAACYATPPERRKIGTRLVDGHGDRGDRYGPFPEGWPWHPDWWKPGDRLRELVKAGALIAAEIDRLIDNG